jgi:hypothetical protein
LRFSHVWLSHALSPAHSLLWEWMACPNRPKLMQKLFRNRVRRGCRTVQCHQLLDDCIAQMVQMAVPDRPKWEISAKVVAITGRRRIPGLKGETWGTRFVFEK